MQDYSSNAGKGPVTSYSDIRTRRLANQVLAEFRSVSLAIASRCFRYLRITKASIGVDPTSSPSTCSAQTLRLTGEPCNVARLKLFRVEERIVAVLQKLERRE
jgi:hypothetical protein